MTTFNSTEKNRKLQQVVERVMQVCSRRHGVSWGSLQKKERVHFIEERIIVLEYGVSSNISNQHCSEWSVGYSVRRPTNAPVIRRCALRGLWPRNRRVATVLLRWMLAGNAKITEIYWGYYYPVPDTSGNGVLFSIDFFVYLFVCMYLSFFLFFFVSKITRKRLDRFAWNIQRRCRVTMGRPDYIFRQFRETARCRDAQHGDGVCCALAPQLVDISTSLSSTKHEAS